MTIVQPGHPASLRVKEDGKYPYCVEFHRAMVNVTALANALRREAEALAGSASREAVLPRLPEALHLLMKRAGDAIGAKASHAYRATSIAGCKKRKACASGAMVQVDDWLTVYLAGPTLGVGIYLTTATPFDGFREVFPISAPRSGWRVYTEVSSGGIAYATPLTSLLSCYSQLWVAEHVSLTESAQREIDEVTQQAEQLLASTAWFDVLKPLDFIAFTDDGVVVPRTWADSLVLASGAVASNPSTTGVLPVVTAMENDAQAAAQTLADAFAMTTSEVSTLRAEHSAFKALSSLAVWTTVPYADLATIVLDGPEARYFIDEPASWLALIPELIRSNEGVMPYTTESYASTVYRLAQACNVALGNDKWTSSWSTKIRHSPHTIDELADAMVERGCERFLGTSARAQARLLLLLARGDVTISKLSTSTGASASFNAMVDRGLTEQPPSVLGFNRLATEFSLSQPVFTRLSENTLRIAVGGDYAELRFEVLSGLSLRADPVDAWLSVSQQDYEKAWDAYVRERQLLSFLQAMASAATASDLVIDPEAHSIRVLSPAALMMAGSGIGVQRSSGSLASPYLLSADSPEVS